MYTSLRYTNWHSVTLDLHASSLLFKEIHAWCIDNFGPINRSKSAHIWDWGSNYGYSIWFSFKHKDDIAQFILTWGEHARIL